MEFLVSYGIDVALIVILFVNIIVSATKGFFKSILSLVCVVAALFAAMTFSQPAAEFVYDNVLSNIIVAKTEQALTEGFNSSSAVSVVNAVIEAVPQILVNQLESLGIDISSVSEQISSLSLSAEDTAAHISEQIIRPGALVLLKLVCYILIFIAVRFILGCIIGLLDKIPSLLPLLGRVNRWLGAALGAGKGVIIILALSILLNALSGVIKPAEFSKSLENSRICAAASELLGAVDLNSIDLNIDKIIN